MADKDAALEEQGLSKKELKKREKAEKKAAKKAAKGGFSAVATDEGGMYVDADEEEGFSLSVLLIVIFIIFIWIAILCLLVKLDIGGFGSDVLYPILKDVPVVNMILPEQENLEEYEGEFDNLPDALAEINRLNSQINELKSELNSGADRESEEVKALKEEITRLRTFEDSQVEFDKLKTEFYEEVVFAEEAPDIENYKKYYEEIDPDNAEYLYKQVVAQMETDAQMKEYVQTYSDMKPKQAAAIFESMTDNLELVAEILDRMEPSARAKIMNVMDADVAAMLTKIMDPE